jgi:hypothetical protein
MLWHELSKNKARSTGLEITNLDMAFAYFDRSIRTRPLGHAVPRDTIDSPPMTATLPQSIYLLSEE